MSDYPARLRALKIMDEVGSDNPLGRDAAAYIEEMEAKVSELQNLLWRTRSIYHASVTRNKTS
jgi:hypothetical protein